MPLKELRVACGVTQQQLGERVAQPQSAISRWERSSSDMRLSTLVAYVEALGGRVVLEINDRRVELELDI